MSKIFSKGVVRRKKDPITINVILKDVRDPIAQGTFGIKL